MKKLILLCLAFALAVHAHAQVTTITASHIEHDPSGQLLTTGAFQLTPVNQSMNPQAYQPCTGGQVLPIAYYWNITNGQVITADGVTAGATVADTACASPSNMGYQVCITTAAHAVLYCYGQPIHPTGGTWSFDAWSPTTVAVVPGSGLFAGGSAPPSGAGQCTAPSVYLQSATQLYTCQGTTWTLFTNLGTPIVWAGAYNSATAYAVGRGVYETVGGVTSSYVSIASSTGAAPHASPSSWQLIASGAAGAAGATGPTGPAGAAGANGAAATLAIGTVTTTAAGTNAAVTNVGTSNAATLNISIPRGAAGSTGPTGPTGPAGAAGAPGAAGATGAAGVGVPTATQQGQLPVSGSSTGNPYAASTAITVAPGGQLRQAIGTPIAASGTNITIAPTAPSVHVGGTGTIAVMTPPTGCAITAMDCTETIYVDASSTWATVTGGGTGGFAYGITPTPGTHFQVKYDHNVDLWYPAAGGGANFPAPGVAVSTGSSWDTPYSVDGTGHLVATSVLSGYCPLTGCTTTGPIQVGGPISGIAGQGTDAYALSTNTAIVGTGATIGCSLYAVCDSISFDLTFNAGTTVTASGLFLTLTLGSARLTNPACPITMHDYTGQVQAWYANVQNATGTVSILFYSTSPLASGRVYYIRGDCGGR